MLKPGAKAPNFHLKSDEGKDIALEDFQGKRVFLFFFPKANTPGWTIEASEFRDAKSKFDKAGVVILGASADSEKALAGFKTKQKLNFPLLSDPAHKMLLAYGAWRLKKFMGRTFEGIPRISYLIGADGKIEQAWDNVKSKGHAAEVLAHLSA
jgi:peroxiredoxin Q/BCP